MIVKVGCFCDYYVSPESDFPDEDGYRMFCTEFHPYGESRIGWWVRHLILPLCSDDDLDFFHEIGY